MLLTTQQEDQLTDILYNIQVSEMERVLMNLSAEELRSLRSQAMQFVIRQQRILVLVDERLESIS